MESDASSFKSSTLLELSAYDDVVGFKAAVEEDCLDFNQPSLWYGRNFCSKKMGFEERTPLMIASLFGSKNIVDYITRSGCVDDINRAYGSDGATAFHCAVAGFSAFAVEIVKLLLDASADPNTLDANGNKPVDMIAPYCSLLCIPQKKMLEGLLKDSSDVSETCGLSEIEGIDRKDILSCRGSERKEYPIDPTLPDIKNGFYGTDEFRMYSFKIKPCSRAYSHDWTECPFVHPGENARRRDPRKYHYSCVPCPEYRKGSCPLGDSCEFSHGIFECWLHPAQYRTRLCKDETNCTRRVCFFAHKQEELRPLYASTGSGVPSPRSAFSSSNTLSYDIGPISPLSFGSPSIMTPVASTPPLTPTDTSSPIGESIWMNLQLPSSRFKSALNARDMDLDEDISKLPSPSSWANSLSKVSPFSGDTNGNSNRLVYGMKPTNLEKVIGSINPPVLSPTGLQMRRGISKPLRPIYPGSSSPVGPDSSFSIDRPSAISPGSTAFAKQSQSFVEESGVSHNQHSAISSSMAITNLKGWGSPDGKLDWSIQGDELNKLRKSASYSLGFGLASEPARTDEPDVSWVGSLIKESSEPITRGSKFLPSWIDHSYLEPEQTVA